MGWSKEARKKMSEAAKLRWKNPTSAMREGMRRRNLKQWNSKRKELQAKYCRDNLKKQWKDPEYRERQLTALHDGLKKRWSRKSARKAQSKQMKKQVVEWRKSGVMTARPSKPQRSLLRKLLRRGHRSFELEVPFGRYSLDVASEKHKICVELDGAYWHSINQTDYDKRDKKLRAAGWTVKRFGTSRHEVRKALHWILEKL